MEPSMGYSPAQEYYRRLSMDKHMLEKLRFAIILSLGTIILVACLVYIIFRCVKNFHYKNNEEPQKEEDVETTRRLLKRRSTPEICTLSNTEFYV